MAVVFCESCCGLPSFWRMMNRTRSSTCVLEGGAIDRWPTEAPQRPQPVRRQTTGARAADSRTRYSWLLKLRAAPCRACSASSRSSGRRAPPSPSPATSSGWLNLEWPGGHLAWAARRRVQLKGACDHGRGPGYPARLRQQVGTFLVGLDCLERVRRVRLQPAHRRTGTGTSRWRAECWHSAESSHPVLISS